MAAWRSTWDEKELVLQITILSVYLSLQWILNNRLSNKWSNFWPLKGVGDSQSSFCHVFAHVVAIWCTIMYYLLAYILNIVNKRHNLRVQAKHISNLCIRGIYQIFPRNYLKNADVVEHNIQTWTGYGVHWTYFVSYQTYLVSIVHSAPNVMLWWK